MQLDYFKLKRKISLKHSLLKYCLSFSGVTTVIPGMINQSQLIENTKKIIFKKIKNEKIKIRKI